VIAKKTLQNRKSKCEIKSQSGTILLFCYGCNYEKLSCNYEIKSQTQ